MRYRIATPFFLTSRRIIHALRVHVDEQIVAAVRRLIEFPESGRPGRVAGTRELVIPRTPYIAAYLVIPEMVRILRVLHGAQIWPGYIDPA
jgi:toxin ParE1/3/4